MLAQLVQNACLTFENYYARSLEGIYRNLLKDNCLQVKALDNNFNHEALTCFLFCQENFRLQPINNQNRMILLEIIEDRHGKGSTLIASKLPVSGRHDIIPAFSNIIT